MNPVLIPLQAEDDAASSLLGLLRAAFEDERRLLQGLEEVLLRQRDAVASNDLDGVNRSVADAQRVLLTLGQARNRRQTLMRAVCGDVDRSPADLEECLGNTLMPDLQTARDNLLSTARSVARTLKVNDRILSGAMAGGRALVKGLGGRSAPMGNPLYGAGGVSSPASAMDAGTVLDRQV